MLFKNAIVYRLATDEVKDLSDKLKAKAFQPCGRLDETSSGWVSPIVDDHEMIVFEIAGRALMCLKTEDKVIIPAIVKEELSNRVRKLEKERGNKIGKKEKQDIKDEIIQEMLPTAPCKPSRIFGYIDYQNKMVVVEATSSKNADKFIESFRNTVGAEDFKAFPIQVNMSVSTEMGRWQKDEAIPDRLLWGDKCSLKNMEDSGTIKYNKQDMGDEGITDYLCADKVIKDAQFEFDETVMFTFTDAFTFKGLKYVKFMDAKHEADLQDFMDQYDFEFNFFTMEVRELVAFMIEQFDGEVDYV
ncbi:recombination-associated protein RdgC [Neptuniibacter sp. QD37_11]|uniref:recombination-associated protein RdgC n=1 Tax=Neptuniibacter sp. QD37_11 TaxID=3398209 RepID=UPI0039F5F086